MALPEAVSFWSKPKRFSIGRGATSNRARRRREKLASDTEFEKKSYVLTDAQSGRR